MSSGTFDFRIGSLNIRGINRHSKRISVYNWVRSNNFDVMLLQETYSSETDENLWQSEWGGPVLWSHGTKHSCGVSILIRKGFDIEPIQCIKDPKGRYIILKALIQNEPMYIINIYAPNTDHDKSVFFSRLHALIDQNGITQNDCVLMGGDWNTVLSSQLDKSGGALITGEPVTQNMKTILIDLGLVDIWRLKNPHTKRFTYRQKRPLIQSRLDYFMITHCMTDMIDKSQILPSFCSDHSCISMRLAPLSKSERGHGYWKFNASLIDDEEYVRTVNQKLDIWNIEYNYIEDKRVKWELMKYEIRNFTRKYSSQKAKNEANEKQLLHDKLNDLEQQLGNNPGNVLNDEYYSCKERLAKLEEIKAKRAIIRSRANWLEEGEKSTRYFFGLEKYNFNRKHV